MKKKPPMSYICVSVLRMICVFMTSEDMQGCCQSTVWQTDTATAFHTAIFITNPVFLNKAPPAQKEPSTQNFSEDLHVKSLDAN